METWFWFGSDVTEGETDPDNLTDVDVTQAESTTSDDHHGWDTLEDNDAYEILVPDWQIRIMLAKRRCKTIVGG